eukprot:c19163_g1_i3.p1 GENE.c19163_g1_i3~~c19163_g1_i3.p1  ORF type:complete len:413 (+),score=95.39 c19163_g1_i3:1280-2518(+)
MEEDALLATGDGEHVGEDHANGSAFNESSALLDHVEELERETTSEPDVTGQPRTPTRLKSSSSLPTLDTARSNGASRSRVFDQPHPMDLAANLEDQIVTLMSPFGYRTPTKISKEVMLQIAYKARGGRKKSHISAAQRNTSILPRLSVTDPDDHRSSSESDSDGDETTKFLDPNFKADHFWIDVEGGTKQDIDDLGAAFQLYPLTIEDMCTDFEERDVPFREKIDAYHTYLYVRLRSSAGLLHIIWNRHYIVTFHAGVLPCVNHARHRVATEIGHSEEKKWHEQAIEELLHGDWLIYFLFDGLMDECVVESHNLSEEVSALSTLHYDMPTCESRDMMLRAEAASMRILVTQTMLNARLEILRRLCQPISHKEERLSEEPRYLHPGKQQQQQQMERQKKNSHSKTTHKSSTAC